MRLNGLAVRKRHHYRLTVWAKDHLCNMVPIRLLTSRRMPAEIRPVPANPDIIWLAGMIFSMSTNIVSAAIHEAADEKKNLRPSNSRRKRSRAGQHAECSEDIVAKAPCLWMNRSGA